MLVPSGTQRLPSTIDRPMKAKANIRKTESFLSQFRPDDLINMDTTK